MARVLEMAHKSVRERIRNQPHLEALLADRRREVQQPPKAAQVLTRVPTPEPGEAAPKERPIRITKEAMAGVVRETEMLIHKGLENFGVPVETLRELRSLHGVQVSTGEFLAQSVMDIQDLYSIELYKIPARLKHIEETYLKNEALPVMEKMFWQKAHTELLEQLGKGKDRMMSGAEAIAEMLKKQDDRSLANAKPAVEAGWTH